MPTGLGSCLTFSCTHPKFQIYFICETVEDSHVRLQFKPFAMILIRTKSGLASPMPELPPATPAILPSTIDAEERHEVLLFRCCQFRRLETTS
jgi:hypothetical protein